MLWGREHHMTMARDTDRERERDLSTLDRVIARMERQADEYDSPQITALFAKELPRLLERRARLLGLDVAKPDESGTQGGSIAAVSRRLEAVK